MEKNGEVLCGIAAYDYEKRVILRVLRMRKTISQFDFDKIFGDTKILMGGDGTGTLVKRKLRLRFLPVGPKSFILGTPLCLRDYSKWLHLTQLMASVGMVEITESDGGCIFYSFPTPNVLGGE